MTAGHAANPAKIIWTLNGADSAITWSEMQELLAWLSKVAGVIDMLGRPRRPNRADRLIDNVENRDWWLREYDLTLS
jgi:hypothetical protein